MPALCGSASTVDLRNFSSRPIEGGVRLLASGSLMPSSPEQLLSKARAVLEALRLGARRAFVVELTGTPKAGKTTTLAVLQGFFKTAGFRVETLKERAADCPLAMKGHFFFNAWTFGTMLAEV